MDKFVVTSLRQSAGKTSVIIGLTKALEKSIGYIKPLGERFLYRKKRLWDYDAALITNIFDLKENPEEMSIGFHHSKLHYILDKESTRGKLQDLLVSVGRRKDLFFAECGKDMAYGSSVHLDAISVAEQLDARIIVVISGDEDGIVDDAIFLKQYIGTIEKRLHGIIINKVANVSDFYDTKLSQIEKQGIHVLGIIPLTPELTYFTLSYLADRLFAKVIAAEEHLNRSVKNIFIGAMSADASLKNPLFREECKIVITSGDRDDMILAAIESGAVAVILTNNIMPSSSLIAQANSLKVPLLLVSGDTYDIARQIENMESLLTKNDIEKITLVEQLVRRHVHLEKVLAR